MKLQVISDIHTEFHPDMGKKFAKNLPIDDADVLIVAGDFGTDKSIWEALTTLSNRVPHIVYVMGNHELYNSSFQVTRELLTNFAAKKSNFHFLDSEIVTINGQRFVGTTMWFPDTPSSRLLWRNLNDFQYIENFQRHVYDENSTAVSFLNENIAADDVVVTHHLPSYQSVAWQRRSDTFNCYYVCDMTSLIARVQPKAWFHGHTHSSCDYKLGDTRVVCNPFGYVGHELNNKFQNHLIVEISP